MSHAPVVAAALFVLCGCGEDKCKDETEACHFEACEVGPNLNDGSCACRVECKELACSGATSVYRADNFVSYTWKCTGTGQYVSIDFSAKDGCWYQSAHFETSGLCD